MKLYHYVGPEPILAKALQRPAGTLITSAQALADCLHRSGQQSDQHDQITLTFIIDSRGGLRVDDRRSEHFTCSAGGPVLSASELFLESNGSNLRVVAASNQSTGYCPEPESWPAVRSALDRLGLPHPGEFPIIFRRCLACGERNIVKNHWFVCALCGTELPCVLIPRSNLRRLLTILIQSFPHSQNDSSLGLVPLS